MLLIPFLGAEIRVHGEREALRLLATGLAAEGLAAADLPGLKKGDPRKARIAHSIRTHTAMPLAWITQHLHMGTPANISHACRRLRAPRLS